MTAVRPDRLRPRVALVDETTKGLRVAVGDVQDPRTIADRGWNALVGDLEYPVLVLHREEMGFNIGLMRDYCAQAGVLLAPHAKTSMSPEIIRAQLDEGAWGVTVATAGQARAVYS